MARCRNFVRAKARLSGDIEGLFFELYGHPYSQDSNENWGKKGVTIRVFQPHDRESIS